jgi:very-short-patch-repair endonuclease
LPTTTIDRCTQLLAAALAHPGTMCSHRSAAWLWGLDRADDEPVDLISARRTRGTALDGVVIHRPRDKVDLRAVIRRGVPTTNPLRTLVDLGAVDAEAVYPTMVHLFAERLVAPRAALATVARHSRKGRHGVVALRQALERYAADELPVDSLLEAKMAELLAAAELPPAVFHARVLGFEVDFLLTGTRIIIECDGWASHGLNRDQFEFDRLRNSELAAAGYIVVHVTWVQLRDHPQRQIERLRAVVARWHPELLAGRRGA